MGIRERFDSDDDGEDDVDDERDDAEKKQNSGRRSKRSADRKEKKHGKKSRKKDKGSKQRHNGMDEDTLRDSSKGSMHSVEGSEPAVHLPGRFRSKCQTAGPQEEEWPV